MPALSVTYNGNNCTTATKEIQIDPQNHLPSLGQAILKMQADMNQFLTEVMRVEAGGKPVEEDPDTLQAEEDI